VVVPAGCPPSPMTRRTRRGEAFAPMRYSLYCVCGRNVCLCPTTMPFSDHPHPPRPHRPPGIGAEVISRSVGGNDALLVRGLSEQLALVPPPAPYSSRPESPVPSRRSGACWWTCPPVLEQLVVRLSHPRVAAHAVTSGCRPGSPGAGADGRDLVTWSPDESRTPMPPPPPAGTCPFHAPRCPSARPRRGRRTSWRRSAPAAVDVLVIAAIQRLVVAFLPAT